MLGLTATATHLTASSILETLGLEHSAMLRLPPVRHNIKLSASRAAMSQVRVRVQVQVQVQVKVRVGLLVKVRVTCKGMVTARYVVI